MAGPEIINCPGCSQEYEASLEHVGLNMTCGECGTVFKVPNLLNVASERSTAEKDDRPTQICEEEMQASRALNASILKSLNEDEMQLLQQEGDRLIGQLQQLKRRNCWEFAVISSSLNNRLERLKKATVDTQHEQTFQGSWKKDRAKFNDFVKVHTKHFFSILKALSKLMAGELETVLASDDVKTLARFTNSIDGQFVKLKEFHKKIFLEPMPQTDDYHLMQEILVGWVPYCCQSFDPVIEKLQENCQKMRDSVAYKPQISFAPPTLHQFYLIAGKLSLGLDRPRSVCQDISL